MGDGTGPGAAGPVAGGTVPAEGLHRKAGEGRDGRKRGVRGACTRACTHL